MARSRRNYSREFKVEAVKLVTEKGMSVAEVARSLGLHETLTVDGAGNETKDFYEMNQVTSEAVYNSGNTLIAQMSDTFDKNGNLTTLTDGVSCLRFSPDSKRLAVGTAGSDPLPAANRVKQWHRYSAHHRSAPACMDNWTQHGSLGFAAGQANLYEYVGNDPLNATDPSGMAAILDTDRSPAMKSGIFGAYLIPVKWTIRNIPDGFTGGVIIQRITQVWKMTTTETVNVGRNKYEAGKTPVPRVGVSGLDATSYYEAWLVDAKGNITPAAVPISKAVTVPGASAVFKEDGINLNDSVNFDGEVESFHDYIMSWAARRQSTFNPLAGKVNASKNALYSLVQGFTTIKAEAAFLPGITKDQLIAAGFKEKQVPQAGMLFSAYDTDQGTRTFNKIPSWKDKNPFAAATSILVRNIKVEWGPDVIGSKGGEVMIRQQDDRIGE